MSIRQTTPVTIITGFLGSGKTTLINRILREMHGQRLAVIENEFGAVGVDAQFLVADNNETIIELANGCLCCTVRGDLARALQQLATQADSGAFAFDRVLIETTGIADPGPIVQTFLAETEILSRFHLDGVITLVDGAHGENQLDQLENRAQIGYADRLLLTKCDLGDTAKLAALSQRIGEMNPRAEIVPVDVHTAPVGELIELLLETRSYQFDYIGREELQRYTRVRQPLISPGSSPSLQCARMARRHTEDVVSCVFESEIALNLPSLNIFFDVIQQRYGKSLWRYKGIVYAFNERPRLIIQGVQTLLQINGGTIWRPFEKRRSVLVFIGQALDSVWITAQLRACEVKEEKELARASVAPGQLDARG